MTNEKRFAAVERCLKKLGTPWQVSLLADINAADEEIAAAEKLLAVAPVNAAQQAQPEMPTVEECVSRYEDHEDCRLDFHDRHLVEYTHEFIRRHIGR
jgi:hypothetical protein